jgi:hypothetical protein
VSILPTQDGLVGQTIPVVVIVHGTAHSFMMLEVESNEPSVSVMVPDAVMAEKSY